jgi:hypothetical protein
VAVGRKRKGEEVTKLDEQLNKISTNMSPTQILLSVLLMGALSGGTGHLAISSFFSDDIARQEIELVDRELAKVTSLLVRLDAQLTIARCEIRALRENFEWWTCYTDPDVPR